MVEGLEALLRSLEQSIAWTGDQWHRSALGQAIVEVETALTLVAPSGYSRMVHDGYSVTRLNDLIYIFDKTQDPGDEDEAGPDDVRPELDHDHSTFVNIFAGGRRCVNRRGVVANGADMPGGIERRSLERRKLDRRGLNRLALIAEIPQCSDALMAAVPEEQNLPLSEF